MAEDIGLLKLWLTPLPETPDCVVGRNPKTGPSRDKAGIPNIKLRYGGLACTAACVARETWFNVCRSDMGKNDMTRLANRGVAIKACKPPGDAEPGPEASEEEPGE